MQLILEFIEEEDIRQGRRPPRWERLDKEARQTAIRRLSRLVALMLTETSRSMVTNDE